MASPKGNQGHVPNEGLPIRQDQQGARNEELALAALGFENVEWDNFETHLRFIVPASKGSLPEQEILKFCKDQTEKKSLERVLDPTAVRNVVFELEKDERHSSTTKSMYCQSYRYKNGQKYQIRGAAVTIRTLYDSSRAVTAHILPQTCTVRFPADAWFVDALSVSLTTMTPETEPGVFRLEFFKSVLGKDGVQLRDVEDKEYHSSC